MRYHPGGLAVATVRGVPGTVVQRKWHGWRWASFWVTAEPVAGETKHFPDVVTDIRTLEA